MEEKKEFIQWLEDNNYFLKKVIEKRMLFFSGFPIFQRKHMKIFVANCMMY